MKGIAVTVLTAALMLAGGTAHALAPPPIYLDVHLAPGNNDGDGSWAWTTDGSDYYPHGVHVFAAAPSKDATTIRNLVVGDRLILEGAACCAFRVDDVNTWPSPWETDASAVILTWTRADGTQGRTILGHGVPY